jgi:hypothetical protein
MEDERGLPLFAPHPLEPPELVAFATDTLAECSRLFHGDLEQLMVLTFVARVLSRSFDYSVRCNHAKIRKIAAHLRCSFSDVSQKSL